MIRTLRRLHRGAWVVLAVGLPVLFAGALMARRTIPTEPRLPGTITSDPAPGDAVWHGELPLDAGTVAMRVMTGVAGAVLELEPAAPLRRSGVLVYWTAAGAPGEARFLGALGGAWAQRFALPPGTPPEGSLRLLSAHDGAVLAEATVGEGS